MGWVTEGGGCCQRCQATTNVLQAGLLQTGWGCVTHTCWGYVTHCANKFNVLAMPKCDGYFVHVTHMPKKPKNLCFSQIGCGLCENRVFRCDVGALSFCNHSNPFQQVGSQINLCLASPLVLFVSF